MKLHFSIAATEELRERRGGRYVLHSVCLEGFLLGMALQSQLRRWDAQLRQLFGSAVPGFPPKLYLVMTKSMADEGQSQLEQYLQNVTLNSNITSSDVFIGFFKKLQLDTFKIPTQRAFLDVYLADGSNVRLDIQTLDTAERLLEVTSCKIGLSRELIKYFSLFFFQDHDDGALSVLKKVADFELPYFLELIREVQFYGYVWLDPCTCDYAEEGCSADICVGNNEINCYIKLPTNQTKEGATKHGEEDTLELRFEYNDSGTWQWITLYTKQAFVLSNCLKKIISEQVMKAAKEGQEMVVQSGFISRKKILVRPSEEDCVFEKIREEDL